MRRMEESKQRIIDIFDENGNVRPIPPCEVFNPMGHKDANYDLLFDDDGDLLPLADNIISELISTSNYTPLCDAVCLIVANTFALNTHGNYSAIYYWR